jgi:beta-ribofuranosylaminobenzene 5'-phosphate synthase
MTSQRIRVQTPSRLHFGLFGWGPQAKRQFGGMGLMIEAPGIELLVEPASRWHIEGPHALRIEQLVQDLERTHGESSSSIQPAHIRVVSAPPEHVGLGVGTQLCLAVARAMFNLSGRRDISLDELTRLTGRGRRSGIGLYGFANGGLIVDGGRKNESDIPPLLSRLAFPEDWSILIVRPPGESGLHGPDEARAFTKLLPMAPEVTDALCGLILRQILPAVIERDLVAFGPALEELEDKVGACFAPAQGGRYAAPQAPVIVTRLRELGLVGVGQSSWGPTLYGFTSRADEESSIIAKRIREEFHLEESAVIWTKAANCGARFSVDE